MYLLRRLRAFRLTRCVSKSASVELMVDNCDSDESWEPPDGQGDHHDFGFVNRHSYDADAPYVNCQTENLDVDAQHLNLSCSDHDSTRTATSNAITCDAKWYGETHAFPAPPKQTIAIDFRGNKRRKQGMHGNQASQYLRSMSFLRA